MKYKSNNIEIDCCTCDEIKTQNRITQSAGVVMLTTANLLSFLHYQITTKGLLWSFTFANYVNNLRSNFVYVFCLLMTILFIVSLFIKRTQEIESIEIDSKAKQVIINGKRYPFSCVTFRSKPDKLPFLDGSSYTHLFIQAQTDAYFSSIKAEDYSRMREYLIEALG